MKTPLKRVCQLSLLQLTVAVKLLLRLTACTSVAKIILNNVQHSCHLREHQNFVSPDHAIRTKNKKNKKNKKIHTGLRIRRSVIYLGSTGAHYNGLLGSII